MSLYCSGTFTEGRREGKSEPLSLKPPIKPEGLFKTTQFGCKDLRHLNDGNIINVWLYVNAWRDGSSEGCCERLLSVGTEPPARECRDNIQTPVGSSSASNFVFSACSATPQPEVGLEVKLLEYTRKTILVGLPSQPKPGSFGKPAKEEKKNQTARESLPAWFPSQEDLEQHLNVSEVIQTRPGDSHSLLT